MIRVLARVSLLILCVGAIVGAGFLLWRLDRSAALDTQAMRRFESQAYAARIGIIEMRAAAQSYVAVGQGEDFWIARVDAFRGELESSLASLRAGASSPAAVGELDTAATALQDFAQVDQRARDHARGHELTLASVMVFGDGFELTKKAGDALDRAVAAERAARDSAAGVIRRQQATALAAAAGVAVLGLLILVPGRRADVVAPAPVAVVPSPARPANALSALDDFDVRPVVKVVKREPAAPPAPVIDVERLASLCIELARVTDSRTMPALLERAAAVLKANGIVLWIADPDGRELAPILIHGYPAQVASRLGTIARDAGNVTASAYRTELLQTMKGEDGVNGAIAVPLVTASGCVGVMAAEVTGGGEQQAPLLAAAAIIGAQLATLVGPPAARARSEAAG